MWLALSLSWSFRHLSQSQSVRPRWPFPPHGHAWCRGCGWGFLLTCPPVLRRKGRRRAPPPRVSAAWTAGPGQRGAQLGARAAPVPGQPGVPTGSRRAGRGAPRSCNLIREPQPQCRTHPQCVLFASFPSLPQHALPHPHPEGHGDCCWTVVSRGSRRLGTQLSLALPSGAPPVGEHCPAYLRFT